MQIWLQVAVWRREYHYSPRLPLFPSFSFSFSSSPSPFRFSFIVCFRFSPSPSLLHFKYKRHHFIPYKISVWDITNEKHIRSFATANILTCLDWSPHDPTLIAYGTDRGVVKVVNYLESTSHQLKENDTAITALRWNPKVKDKLIVGDDIGNIYLYDVEANSKRKLKSNQNNLGSVVDLHWDPLSENYFLAGFRNGILLYFQRIFYKFLFIGVVILFDVDTEMEIQSFEMQSTGT